MAKYTIQQGDCLSSIALARGFDPQHLWDHPGNAALKQQRKSPNALLPGDQLEIPALEEREESVATGSIGRFQLSVGPIELRLRLTRHGEARADEAYELAFEDGAVLDGTTDADGWIVQPIPIVATRATLSLANGQELHELLLGHLDPHDTATGVQQRLRALGYYFGPVGEGAFGPDGEGIVARTTSALCRFQTKEGLPITGEADEPTVAALFDVYGS